MQLAFESQRTQLCVKRLVVLERREFTVGLLTALNVNVNRTVY